MSSGHGLALSSGVRRFLAVGLLLAALAALSGGILRPLFRWSQEAAEQLADARFALARAQSVALSDKALSVAQTEQAERELLPSLLNGVNESEAAASLQSAADRALRGEALLVESALSVPTLESGGIRRLSLDWRGTGSEGAVIRAIATLERTRPLIWVERLTLRATEVGVSTSQQTPEPRLSIEVRLTGFWAPPALPSPQPAKVTH